MPKIDWNTAQGSAAWMRARLGIPTASAFDEVMTPKTMKMSESRWKYACCLIAGRLLNWQADSLDKIAHIQAGRDNEPLAVARLEILHDIETRPVGFIKTDDGRFGASPDRVVMNGDAVAITVECKCPTIPVQFQYLLLGHDASYRCQVQGQLWVAEAEKAIFQAFNPHTPDYTVDTPRDEEFIRNLRNSLEQFSDELEALDAKARSLGVYQAFAELATPLEAEYVDEVDGGAAAKIVIDAAAKATGAPPDELDQIMGWDK